MTEGGAGRPHGARPDTRGRNRQHYLTPTTSSRNGPDKNRAYRTGLSPADEADEKYAALIDAAFAKLKEKTKR